MKKHVEVLANDGYAVYTLCLIAGIGHVFGEILVYFLEEL